MEKIKKGIYRHYKGNEYKVLSLATNSETQEEVVIYQELESEQIWCRPKEIFLEEVETEEGKKVRFEFISDEPEDSWENKYLRALADYQNLTKQTLKDKQEFVKFATEDFLHDLLPVYDHLKLSLKGLSDEEKSSAWAVGVSHVLKQFKDVLNSRGVEEVVTVGQKFNHDTMEAIDGEGEIVATEIMPGYKLGGKVIRPAKVTVKKENEEKVMSDEKKDVEAGS